MSVEPIDIEDGSPHGAADDKEGSEDSVYVDGESEEDEDESDEGDGDEQKQKGTEGGEPGGGGSAAGGGGTKAQSVSGNKRKRERDSPCWKYFEDDPKDPTVVVCTMCKKRIKTGGGTTNARQHVMRMHKNIATADGLVEATIRQQKIDGKVLFHPNYVRKAAKWIVKNYLVSDLSGWVSLESECPVLHRSLLSSATSADHCTRQQ